MSASERPTPPSSAAAGAQLTQGVFFAICAVVIALLLVVFLLTGPQTGHLTPPLVQWAFGTPLGALALMVVGTAIVGTTFLLPGRAIFDRALARAADVTDLAPSARPQRSRGTGSDVVGAHRTADVILAAVAVLLAVALAGVFIAAMVYGWQRNHQISCVGTACPPAYPMLGLTLAPEFAVIALGAFRQYRWVRQAEERCGIRFTYTGSGSGPLRYVRLPGTEPDAVAAALRAYRPARAISGLRVFVWTVFAVTPLIVLISAGVFLGGWLPGQWVPR